MLSNIVAQVNADQSGNQATMNVEMNVDGMMTMKMNGDMRYTATAEKPQGAPIAVGFQGQTDSNRNPFDLLFQRRHIIAAYFLEIFILILVNVHVYGHCANHDHEG